MQADEKVLAETTAQSSGSSDQDPIEQTTTVPNYTLKLDLRLIPILGCTYTILFLDRTNSELYFLVSQTATNVLQSPMPESKGSRRACTCRPTATILHSGSSMSHLF